MTDSPISTFPRAIGFAAAAIILGFTLALAGMLTGYSEQIAATITTLAGVLTLAGAPEVAAPPETAQWQLWALIVPGLVLYIGGFVAFAMQVNAAARRTA